MDNVWLLGLGPPAPGAAVVGTVTCRIFMRRHETQARLTILRSSCVILTPLPNHLTLLLSVGRSRVVGAEGGGQGLRMPHGGLVGGAELL